MLFVDIFFHVRYAELLFASFIAAFFDR
jgi:hypothetical protein